MVLYAVALIWELAASKTRPAVAPARPG
jgi:hypothetical protein